jgi:hypothetical protein
MIEVKVEQGSQEWLRMRLGKITGTRLKEVFKSDNLPLIDEMIAEIISEEIEENFVNNAMQRGKDLEPVVRDLYTQVTGIEIEEVGFCLSEENDFLALSPDGFTPDRTGAIEIKCPSTKVHVKYIRQDSIPNEYKYQIFNYFLVNQDLEYLDFISFDDRFKIKPMYVKRIHRNEIQTELYNTNAELEKFCTKFLKYYEKITK